MLTVQTAVHNGLEVTATTRAVLLGGRLHRASGRFAVVGGATRRGISHLIRSLRIQQLVRV
jgi:hypothetical protein